MQEPSVCFAGASNVVIDTISAFRSHIDPLFRSVGYSATSNRDSPAPLSSSLMAAQAQLQSLIQLSQACETGGLFAMPGPTTTARQADVRPSSYLSSSFPVPLAATPGNSSPLEPTPPLRWATDGPSAASLPLPAASLSRAALLSVLQQQQHLQQQQQQPAPASRASNLRALLTLLHTLKGRLPSARPAEAVPQAAYTSPDYSSLSLASSPVFPPGSLAQRSSYSPEQPSQLPPPPPLPPPPDAIATGYTGQPHLPGDRSMLESMAGRLQSYGATEVRRYLTERPLLAEMPRSTGEADTERAAPLRTDRKPAVIALDDDKDYESSASETRRDRARDGGRWGDRGEAEEETWGAHARRPQSTDNTSGRPGAAWSRDDRPHRNITRKSERKTWDRDSPSHRPAEGPAPQCDRGAAETGDDASRRKAAGTSAEVDNADEWPPWLVLRGIARKKDSGTVGESSWKARTQDLGSRLVDARGHDSWSPSGGCGLSQRPRSRSPRARRGASGDEAEKAEARRCLPRLHRGAGRSSEEGR